MGLLGHTEYFELPGLDRIPEARTLRDKVRILTETGQAQQWGGALSRDWMAMFGCTAAAVVPPCHHRLLGECHGRPAVFHGEQVC